MARTRVFAISGYSGSGKTTLISKLIAGFRKKGKSIAVIKSSREDILAPSGTDTRQHQDAGADPVIILGPRTTTTRYRERKELKEILNDVRTDFTLLEGFKKLAIPRFWCISKNEQIADSSLLYSIKAVVSWEAIRPDDMTTDVPYFTQSEVDKLVSIIETHASEVDDVLDGI